MYRCSGCELQKDIEEFYKNKSRPSGISSKCKQCDNERIKIWNEKNIDKKREYSKKASKKYREAHKHEPQWKYKKRIRDVRLRFGLSEEGLNNLIKEQKNCCAICKKPFVKTPHVDHIEVDNKIIVRGLLCSNCNTSIGLLSDDPTIIKRAAKYVKEKGA